MSVVDKQRVAAAATLEALGNTFSLAQGWTPPAGTAPGPCFAPPNPTRCIRPPDGSGRFIPRTINQERALYMQLRNTGSKDSNGLPRCGVAVPPPRSFQHVLRKSRLLAGLADLTAPSVRVCTPGDRHTFCRSPYPTDGIHVYGTLTAAHFAEGQRRPSVPYPGLPGGLCSIRGYRCRALLLSDGRLAAWECLGKLEPFPTQPQRSSKALVCTIECWDNSAKGDLSP